MIIRKWSNIAKAMGVSVSTARRWQRLHGLPVAPTPNGEMMITKDLINQWVLARAQIHQARKTTPLPKDVSLYQLSD